MIAPSPGRTGGHSESAAAHDGTISARSKLTVGGTVTATLTFVLGLVGRFLPSLIIPWLWILYLAIIGLYLGLLTLVGVRAALKKKQPSWLLACRWRSSPCILPGAVVLFGSTILTSGVGRNG